MTSERTKIFTKNEKEIQERIARIENNLLGVKMDTGQPTPNKEQKWNINERMSMYNVPGCCITIINNNVIEWAKCYGVKDNRTKEEVTFDTLFEAGSTSKVLTAVAAIHAVEKQLINLDDPINDKLISWKIPENEFTKKSKVTLQQLLTHTAGINHPDSMFGYEDNSQPTLIQVLNGELPALNDPVDVVFTPGSKHQYSNLGFIIIEKLLNDLYNNSFSEVIKGIIFDPLKMTNSSFEYPSKEILEKTAVPHDEKGEPHEIRLHLGASAHGGLLTNPLELSQFNLELMHTYQGKSHKVLSQNIAKTMFTTLLPLDPKKFFGWTGQGLGIFLIQQGDDIFFLHPGTNTPGAVCMMIGSPTTAQGAVIMSNGIGAELLHIELLFSIVQEYKWPIYK